MEWNILGKSGFHDSPLLTLQLLQAQDASCFGAVPFSFIPEPRAGLRAHPPPSPSHRWNSKRYPARSWTWHSWFPRSTASPHRCTGRRTPCIPRAGSAAHPGASTGQSTLISELNFAFRWWRYLSMMWGPSFFTSSMVRRISSGAITVRKITFPL